MATYYIRNVKLQCAACRNDICDNLYTRCHNDRCNSPFYHNQCATISERAANWLCPKCIYDENRPGTLLAPEPMISNVTQHKSRFGTLIGTQTQTGTLLGNQYVHPQHGNPFVGSYRNEYTDPFGMQHANAHQQVPSPTSHEVRSQQGIQPTGRRTEVGSRGTVNRDAEALGGTTSTPATKYADPNIALLTKEIQQLRRKIAALNEQCITLENSNSVTNSRLDDVCNHLGAEEHQFSHNEQSEASTETEEESDTDEDSALQYHVHGLFKSIQDLKHYDEIFCKIVASIAENNGIELDESDVEFIPQVRSKYLTQAAKLFCRLAGLNFTSMTQHREFSRAANFEGNTSTAFSESRRTDTNERVSREFINLLREARNRTRTRLVRREEHPALQLLTQIELLKKLSAQYRRNPEQFRRDLFSNT